VCSRVSNNGFMCYAVVVVDDSRDTVLQEIQAAAPARGVDYSPPYVHDLYGIDFLHPIPYAYKVAHLLARKVGNDVTCVKHGALAELVPGTTCSDMRCFELGLLGVCQRTDEKHALVSGTALFTLCCKV
jgi:hypothetical protein